VVKDRSNTSIATQEVPQILVQGILAYDKNPSLDSHTGFVVSLDKTALHVSMAAMSRAYMENLGKGNPSSERLQFRRSQPYDLLEPDGRREALRLLVGLFRYLDQEASYSPGCLTKPDDG
jgi:hypothetical protein